MHNEVEKLWRTRTRLIRSDESDTDAPSCAPLTHQPWAAVWDYSYMDMKNWFVDQYIRDNTGAKTAPYMLPDTDEAKLFSMPGGTCWWARASPWSSAALSTNSAEESVVATLGEFRLHRGCGLI